MIQAIALSSVAVAALAGRAAHEPPLDHPYPFVPLASPEEVAAFEAVRHHVRMGEYESAAAWIGWAASHYDDPSAYGEGHLWKAMDEHMRWKRDRGPGIWLAMLADAFDLHQLALDEYDRHLRTGRGSIWTSKDGIAGYAARCAVLLGDLELADAYLAHAQERIGDARILCYLKWRGRLTELRARPADLGVRVRWLLDYWAEQQPPYRRPTGYVRRGLEAIVDELGEREAPAVRAQLYTELQELEARFGSADDAAAWSLRLSREVGFRDWAKLVETGVPSLRRIDDAVDLELREGRYHLTHGWGEIWRAGERLQERGHFPEAADAFRVFLEAQRSPRPSEPNLAFHIPVRQHHAAERLSACYEAMKDFERAYEYQLAAMETYPSSGSCFFGSTEEAVDRARLERLDALRR